MYVYTYHVPHLNAIKIGYGEKPWNRMDDYAYMHNLNPDAKSLRFWRSEDARELEAYLHNNLGLKRVRHGRATELFLLKNSYENTVARADQMLHDVTGTKRASAQSSSDPKATAVVRTLVLMLLPPIFFMLALVIIVQLSPDSLLPAILLLVSSLSLLGVEIWLTFRLFGQLFKWVKTRSTTKVERSVPAYRPKTESPFKGLGELARGLFKALMIVVILGGGPGMWLIALIWWMLKDKSNRRAAGYGLTKGIVRSVTRTRRTW